MKVKTLLIFACLIMAVGATAQQQPSSMGQLGCDSTTQKKDTIRGEMVFVDSVTHTLVTQPNCFAVRTTCRLMYYGINGSPNAMTDNYGVKEVTYYDRNRKPIPEKWILKLITK